MDVLKLCGLGIGAALMAMLLRRMRPEAGLGVAVAGGLLLLTLLLPQLQIAVSGITQIAAVGHVPEPYMAQLLKVGGISLLTDFSAQTCRDAKEDGLAMKVELAGRVSLIVLSLPYMQLLLTQIMSLSP